MNLLPAADLERIEPNRSGYSGHVLRVFLEAQQIDDGDFFSGVQSGFELLRGESKWTKQSNHAHEDHEFPDEEHEERNAKDQDDGVGEGRDVSSYLIQFFSEEKAAADVGSGPKRRSDGVIEEKGGGGGAKHSR